MRFPRPKILLVDLPRTTTEVLEKAGYRVRSGTFGSPYRVAIGDGYQPVRGHATLPEYREQEIVVVNVATSEPTDEPTGELTRSLGAAQLWAPVDTGTIDPRPKLMRQVRDDFDRIYAHGGVFIVFVAPREAGRYVIARKPPNQRLVIEAYEKDLGDFDSWCFLSSLDADNVNVERDTGREISIAEEASGAPSFLQRHLNGARFEATIQSTWDTRGRWLSLAHNKFEQPVAAVITPEPERDEGWILLLPQVERPGELLVDLLGSLLPTLAPRLFPHVEGAKWVLRPEYELPRIVELKADIEAEQKRTRELIDELETQIHDERVKSGYMHDLLTRDGSDLVTAVRTALQRIGFQQVEDADENVAADLREDLRLHDRSPLLLVEVKGLSALPSEADALQVTKYLAPRMRELKRFDIQGLSVINHQRNLPALDRQNVHTFQQDVLTNAVEHGFGLLTTWDLYRLVRNASQHGWSFEQVAPVLYRIGRIEPIPEHFTFIGLIDGVWRQASAVGIKLAPERSLAIGMSIAFEGKVDFLVENVRSMQIDRRPIQEVTDEAHVGVEVGDTIDSLRDGLRVFLVG